MSNQNNMKMDGVIPFTRTFEPKNLTMVKYSRSETDANGVTEKVTAEVPVLPVGYDRQQLLFMISKFEKARDMLQWTTGDKMFQNFEKQFDDATEWDAHANAQNNDANGFNAALTSFLRTKFPSNAWEKHITMLRSIKKPFKMNPQEFATLLRFHNALLSSLPGKPATNDPTPTRLTEYELRMTLYQAMPKQYQRKFVDAGNRVLNSAIADMEQYFETQYEMDDQVTAEVFND